jgi:O-methyltransferase
LKATSAAVTSRGGVIVRRLVKQVLGGLGYDVVRRGSSVETATAASEPVAVEAAKPPARAGVADIDAATMATYDAVREYTMTSLERVAALCEAVRYVTRHGIQGDLVECGVWRGGSMLAAARTLLEHGDRERTLWLYDTFTGMSEPTEVDVRDTDGSPAAALLASHDRSTDLWAVSPLDEVKRVMALCDYPAEKVRYVPGKVEDTIPADVPARIAILRLDTDWYESTHHELVHLFPRVIPGGVVIVDDYGFWQGSRRAVDEYLAATNARLLLNRIDDTGRIAVVPG